MSDPKPNWFIFNRVSLLPAVGIALIVWGGIQVNPWLVAAGAITAAFGTWLTMRRLTGRISERSVAWVVLDTAVVVVGGGLALGLRLSGVLLWLVVGVPAFVSDSIATALTGVEERH